MSVRDTAWHDALLDKYQEEIVAMLTRRLAPDQRDAARDLAQKTFQTAWTKRDRVPDEPRPWLFKTAGNHLRNFRRWSLRSRPELCVPDALEEALAASSSWEHAIDVRRALARVNRRDRRMLFLSHVEGLGSEEIAALEGLSAGAVRQRLSRASKQIRAALGPDYTRDDHGDRSREGR